jgi:probable HAF family extracellular repeat protein
MIVLAARRLMIALIGLGLVGLTWCDAARAATLRGLGDLPGGGYASGAHGISADGCTVVGVADGAAGSEAFRWTAASGIVGLGDLGGGAYSSGAWNVSADGKVIVGTSATANGVEAFRWTAASGMVSLGDFSGGSTLSVAHGVSADGSVIVGYGNTATGQEAFRWTQAAGLVSLGDFAGGDNYSAAAGVSSDGRTIVGFGTSNSGVEAVRWNSAGAMVGLGQLPGGAYFSGANSLSGDGATVVGTDYSNLNGEAFVWSSSGGITGLGKLPTASNDDRSEAYDVSVTGRIAVGFATLPIEGSVAIVWDEAHGMRRLDTLLASLGVNLAGWKLTEATAISDNGQTIVGRGVNAGGYAEGWMATLPPLATAANPGDANGDGRVNRADLAALLKEMGTMCGASFSQGDFNSDGAVSMTDLVMLQQHYGALYPAASPAASIAAVPEPNLALAGLLAVVVLCGGRMHDAHRRRHCL